MSQHFRTPLAAAAAALFAAALSASGHAVAQDNANSDAPEVAPQHSLGYSPSDMDSINSVTNSNLLQVPLVKNIPGSVKLPELKNPMANDPESAQRGKTYFTKMNCAGCHAANGAGGLGPTLSEQSRFRFGSEPAHLYLVISHGGPTGMPAWGSVLPHNVIWDLVSYIESINKDPTPAWGRTVNLAANEPGTEQVPAEFKDTTTPWQYLEKFAVGKKPTDHKPTSGYEVPDNASAQQ